MKNPIECPYCHRTLKSLQPLWAHITSGQHASEFPEGATAAEKMAIFERDYPSTWRNAKMATRRVPPSERNTPPAAPSRPLASAKARLAHDEGEVTCPRCNGTGKVRVRYL